MSNATPPADTGIATQSYSLIDELNAAVATRGSTERVRILERITDLFAAGSRGYSTAEIAIFDDILTELSSDIEVEARARLANRLAVLSDAPPNVIHSLAFDDAIEVAGPVLTQSEQLSETDLINNASIGSQKHLLAIARRLKLTPPLTDVLAERGDSSVLRTVTANAGARFSLFGFETLAARSQYDPVLAVTLGARGDLPRQIFLKLLEGASAIVRTKLEVSNPQAARTVSNAIDDVATKMQEESRHYSHESTASIVDARSRVGFAPFTENSVYARAHAQEFERTAIALAKLSRVNLNLVERALLDKGDEMILILAKVAGCSWDTTKELLLMYCARRDLQPAELSQTRARYGRLLETTAQKVVRFYEARLRLRGEARGDGQSCTAGGLRDAFG